MAGKASTRWKTPKIGTLRESKAWNKIIPPRENGQVAEQEGRRGSRRKRRKVMEGEKLNRSGKAEPTYRS